MRLSAIQPKLPSHIINALAQLNIRTEVGLLFENGTPLDIFGHLPPDSMTFEDLLDVVDAVTNVCSSRGQTALEIHQLQSSSPNNLGTIRCPNQDSERSSLYDLAFQTMSKSQIIEVSGDNTSEKSVIILSLVMEFLANNQCHGAFWMDCDGSFSVESAKAFALTFPNSDDLISRLHVCTAFDIQSVYQSLESASNIPQVSLVVINPITTIISPLFSGVSSQGHAIMVELMRHFRSWLETLPTGGGVGIVINHSIQNPSDGRTSPNRGTRKPALGPSFTYLSDACLWLCDDPSVRNVIQASLLRSRNMVGVTHCITVLTPGGLIRMKGPITNSVNDRLCHDS